MPKVTHINTTVISITVYTYAWGGIVSEKGWLPKPASLPGSSKQQQSQNEGVTPRNTVRVQPHGGARHSKVPPGMHSRGRVNSEAALKYVCRDFVPPHLISTGRALGGRCDVYSRFLYQVRVWWTREPSVGLSMVEEAIREWVQQPQGAWCMVRVAVAWTKTTSGSCTCGTTQPKTLEGEKLLLQERHFRILARWASSAGLT